MTLVMMTAVSGRCNSFYCLGNFKNVYDDDDDDDDDSTINIVVAIIIVIIIYTGGRCRLILLIKVFDLIQNSISFHVV